MSETFFDSQRIVQALDRVGRYQYAIAGDYLEWTLAQTRAAFSAPTPAEFISKQVELSTSFGEKLRARAQEFLSLAGESQASFAEAVKDTSTKVAEIARKKIG